MVTIIGLEKKTNLKSKESYLVLLVQGSAEVLTSKASGRAYISSRRASVPCALSDVQAKALIGQKLPGSIEKVACAPFEVKLPTGKKLKISETYQFRPEPEKVDTVIG
jgi:hypothetical protein